MHIESPSPKKQIGARLIITLMKGKQKTKTIEKREAFCSACHLKMAQNDGQERLTCSGCSVVVHKNCFNPSFEERGKIRWKCDQCKHQSKGRQTRAICSVCGRDREYGVLKYVGQDEWMHVLCALSSPRTKLVSYRTLAFLAEGPQGKKIAKGLRCVTCSNERGPGLPCLIAECSNYSHLNCVALPKPQQDNDEYNAFLTIGLMDKHEDSLLLHFKQNKAFSFKGLQLYPQPTRQIRYFVCSQHNRDEFFIWCHCGKDTQDTELIQCQGCGRWYHGGCSNSRQLCNGCVHDNIYEKNVSLGELVARAAKLQQIGQFDKMHIKFLDHFCLKLSEQLEKLLANSELQVERYYLRKTLEKTDLDDPQQVDTALEILYYLQKKNRKSKEQITAQEIQQIIQAFSKGNKFNWKSERVEKRFKAKLEDLLKTIRRDGTREIKSKLQEFIKRNQAVTRTHAEIASDLVQLTEALQASEGWRESYMNFPSRQPEKHLIEFFYEMKFSADEVTAILHALRTLYNPKGKGTILESEYLSISPVFQRALPDQKKRIFEGLFDSVMRDLSLRKTYKERLHLRGELQGKLKGCRSGKEREGIRQSIISNRLLVTSASPLMQIQKDSIQLSILRRKILKKSQDPTPSDLPQLRALVAKILQVDSRSQGLSHQQRQNFQHTLQKFSFYETLHNYAKDCHIQAEFSSESAMVQEGSEAEIRLIALQGKKIQRPTRVLSLRERGMAAMMDWKLLSNEAIAFALNETHKLAQSCVSFDEKQKQTVFQFCENIIEYFSRAIEGRDLIPTGTLVQKLNRIAQYCQFQSNYPTITSLYKLCAEWKKEFQIFDDISIALEHPKQTEALLRAMYGKLDPPQSIGLDLSAEARKLKVVRLWCQLSLKLHPNNRSTITAIQTTKSLMDRMKYPDNCLRRRVEALETESKSLNKRISLFLEKQRHGELEIYEQLKLMSGKMTIEQGVELQQDLQVSELDVEVELQELIQEIKEYRSFPKNLAQLIESQPLDALLSLRRKLFQSSFRLDNESLQLYHRLLTRITQLKCLQFQSGSPLTKKDYFKYINSGVAGAELFSETMALHRGYRQVQKAEKELLSLKPKFDNLLQGDCRRVKEDLRDDAAELGKVTRWVAASDKARQRYRQLRASRGDIALLSNVEAELLRIPINNQHILSEISTVRRQLQELTNKAKTFLQGADPTVQFNSPFVMDIVAKYHLLGVRCEYLDKFEGLYNRSRSIFQFAKNPSPDHYARFRKQCEESPELSNNNEVYRAREIAFHFMARLYLQSRDNLCEVGYTLLGEGGFLMKYPNRVEGLLATIGEIYEKFNKWSAVTKFQRAQDQQEDEVQGSQEMQDQDEMEDDEQDEEQIDEDIDEDDSIRSESSSSHRNRKRPRESAVVELDDD